MFANNSPLRVRHCQIARSSAKLILCTSSRTPSFFRSASTGALGTLVIPQTFITPPVYSLRDGHILTCMLRPWGSEE